MKERADAQNGISVSVLFLYRRKEGCTKLHIFFGNLFFHKNVYYNERKMEEKTEALYG